MAKGQAQKAECSGPCIGTSAKTSMPRPGSQWQQVLGMIKH
jgi:hypothetical protein